MCKTFIKSDTIAHTHHKKPFYFEINMFILNLVVICMHNNLMQINLIRTPRPPNCIRFHGTTGYYVVIIYCVNVCFVAHLSIYEFIFSCFYFSNRDGHN